ncbi:MAG: TonB-dependent receptor [Bacteroidales bacterium]
MLWGVLILANSSIFAGEQQHIDTASIALDTLGHTLDQIVIAATRTSKKIVDVPYPVTLLKSGIYQCSRKAGADDILAPVPGLFLQSYAGNYDVRISGRGFGNNTNTGVRGVRIMMDGIPESDPDGQTSLDALDFNAIGHIEVVRGNASSLYLNAPGGVIDFCSDMAFNRSSVLQFNQFGSAGYHQNGFKAAIKTDHYRLLTSYAYVNNDGFRDNSSEFRHVLNMVLEVTPSAHSKLSVLGYFADGTIKLPGGLTKEEFDQNPWQADSLFLSRDEKQFTNRGRVGVRYWASFGKNLNNEIEITAYGAIRYLERTTEDFRIINRYGYGLNARYIHKCQVGSRLNEFSVGGDLFLQPTRTASYANNNGVKGDQLKQVVSDDVSNKGIYVSDNFEILKRKMFVLLTGRFDNVTYNQKQETLPTLSDRTSFNTITPKLALNYLLTTDIAFYASFAWSFNAPAALELVSPDPGYIYNKELGSGESQNFEAGIKGNHIRPEHAFFSRFSYEATFFRIQTENGIVPYEVLGEPFFRNEAKTKRLGAEFGTQIEIFKGLTLGATYTFSHLRYLSYVASFIGPDSLQDNSRDFSGNIMPGIPQNNVYVSLGYSGALNSHFTIFAQAGYRGVSGIWLDDANSAETKPYNLLNGTLGAELKFGKFNIMASGGVNNILNEKYVGYTLTNSPNHRFYAAGAPRSYFGSINIGYGF